MPKISEHFIRFKLLSAKLEKEATDFMADSHLTELKDPAVFIAVQDLQDAAKKTIKVISENLDFKMPDKL